jgi:transcriptional regulator with XRE-family HTH domain
VHQARASETRDRLSAGGLLRQARRARGLSQRELARRGGVSRTTVVEIEAGRRDPGVRTLKVLLSTLGFDLEMRLVPSDEHDRTLEATLAALEPARRAEIETGFDRFLHGLAVGLADSRALVGGNEPVAS